MNESENISEYYYQNLHKAKAPHILLSAFFCRVFEKEDSESKYYPIMGRLVKLYGRERTFFAILDLYDMEDSIDWNRNLFPLLSYMIKKRLNKDIGESANYRDLTNYVSYLKKKLDKQSVDIEKLRDAFNDE